MPPSHDHLRTLLKLGQMLNSSLELRQVLDTTIEQVITFVGAERGFVLLVDTETGRVWGEAVHNLERSALEATLSSESGENSAEISRTIIESVLQSKQAIVSMNAMEDPRFAGRQSVQFHNLRSVLCVPLLAQGKLLGIIYLDNRLKTGVFDEQGLSLLNAYANQAAIAIENARLYQNLQRSLEDRLQLQDELHSQETRRLALEEASKLKSDFIGMVAHELRNPLTTIRGYIQTIRADEEHTLPEESIQEFYEAIETDADRLLDMINELLDMSRLEAGRPLTLACREISLKKLLEKLVRRHQFYKYITPRHSLVLNYPEDVPDTLTADEDKLSQVFSNLLSNAIKYSPEGGEIRISVLPDGSEGIQVRIKDQGVGLTAEQCSRLFRQYERVERDEIKNIPGTGLGLHLVKHLAELHGGSISVESEKGAGSVFTVRLPFSPVSS